MHFALALGQVYNWVVFDCSVSLQSTVSKLLGHHSLMQLSIVCNALVIHAQTLAHATTNKGKQATLARCMHKPQVNKDALLDCSHIL